MPSTDSYLQKAGQTFLFLCLAFLMMPPATAHASSVSLACQNNLRQIVIALHDYREAIGDWPKNICDKDGRPLLSWRVALLPFIEADTLYRQFHLDEAWNSPHNRRLIDRIPKIYRCFSFDGPPGSTSYLAPHGKSTAFRGREGRFHVPETNQSTIILVIEVDAAHGVIWTKPDDLHYDEANPRKGLGQRHRVGFFADRAAFAAFADATVGSIAETTEDAVLRSLFSADDTESKRLALTWPDAAADPRMRYIFGPAFAIGFVAVLGGLIVVARLLRGKPISPGEMLWVIVAANQLALLIGIAAQYRPDLVPNWVGQRDPQWDLWFFPFVAAALASVFAAIQFRRVAGWRTLFIASSILYGLAALDAERSRQHITPEERLITAGAPIFLGFIGIAAAVMTRSEVPSPDASGRRLAHWLGIVVSLLPLAFFLACFIWGVVAPRALFVHIIIRD